MYFYSASAVGVGGTSTINATPIISAHPSVVLPVVGGHVYQQAQSFNANGLSFKNAHTEVNGSFDEDHNLYTTYAVSVVEQLNIADIVTADRVVSRMAVYSPEKTASGEHSFDITGSYFENLRIAGNAVDVKLATHRLHQIDTFSKFEAAYHSDELRDLQPWGDIGAKCFEELKALEEQYVGLWGIAEMAGEWRHRKQPLDLDSYWISAAGHLRLQEQLGPDSGLQNFGSIICIPKIGCIHIGEMLVDKSSRLLNMLRINLEAPWNERISIGSVEIKSRDYRGTSKIIPEKRRAMKNEVKWVSEQPSQWRTSLGEFQTLENSLPSGLQPKNHGDYVDPLKQLGEGKIEGVVGYLYGAKPEGSETSNCGLPDTPNHEDVDFHIYIGFDPAVAATLRKSRNGSLTSAERAQISAHALHSTAVIVEMTPHYRESFHPGWTIDELNAVVGDQVRVVGQLMVDNEHYQAGQDCAVDPSKPACWRATVWEIHPVIDFRYCAKGNNDGCAQNSPADWTDVADAPSAPNASTANTKGAKGQPKSAKSDQPLRLSPGYQRQVTGTP